jgi:hypothetical protein
MLSPYFDHVERELRAAVRRQAHLPWFVRLRARRPRALIVVLAALLVAGPTFAAVELLQRGSSVAPNPPPTPNANNGVALRGANQLLALRVPDPAGGPPWGMRVVRTTRGLLCIQVGRVAFGTVGALGRDGAFGNDGRFHPFSANYQPGPPCVTPDARGNGFLNVAEHGVPTSALFGDDRNDSCRTTTLVQRAGEPAFARRRGSAFNKQAICNRADLRDLYFGLLGPDAVSVTYSTASGKLATSPTTGPDGAYLIVQPDNTPSQDGEYTYDPAVVHGAVSAVRYRDGHTCAVAGPGGGLTCQPVGYVRSTSPLPPAAQVRSHVSARVELAKVWCVPEGAASSPPNPCPGLVPAGFRRLQGGPPSALILMSWISRVPVTNGHSYYYFTISRPPHPNPRYGRLACAGSSDFGQTDSDYAAGQRITQWTFENLSCQGVAHGKVSLVIDTGPATPAPMPPGGPSVGREVGNFSVNIP